MVENYFCWSKMQAESGQQLDTIIRRKELERQACDGIFLWGIGNSLGNKVSAMYSGRVNKIYFSKMLSKPKVIDETPEFISVWTKGLDIDGQLSSLPKFSLVMSRAYTATGKLKKKHYALVCGSSEKLFLGNHGSFNISEYKNLGSVKNNIGASQVTTVVEKIKDSQMVFDANTERRYDVHMTAQLNEPYFLSLTEPLVLRASDVHILLNSISNLVSYKTIITEIKKLPVIEKCNAHDLFSN